MSGLAKFSSAVRFANLNKNIGRLGLETGFKASVKREVTHIGDMVHEAGKISASRLKSAEAVMKRGSNAMINKVARDTIEAGRVADTVITFVKNAVPFGKRVEVTSIGEKVIMPAENTHTVENKLKDMFTKVMGNNSTKAGKISENILKVLEENSISVEEFQRIKLTPVEELTEREKNIIFYIRESIEKPTSDTLMSKVVPIDSINGYLREVNPYTTIGGYVAKYEDVANATGSYEETIETLRLDYTSKTKEGEFYRPYPDDGDSYAVIRFKYQEVSDDLIDIPYGTEFNWTNTDSYPCTRNGFLGGRNETIVPEWYVGNYDKAAIQEGAKMYKVIDSKEELIAVFDGERFMRITK